MFPADLWWKERGMEMGIYFGSAPFTPSCMFGSYPSLPPLCPLIVPICPVVFFGMAGCLGLVVLGERDPLATSFGDLACCKLECRLGAYPVDSSAFWTPPEYWDADDIALEMSDTPNILTDGSREDFSAIGGYEVAGAGVHVLASELAFDGSVLVCWRRSKVMLAWSVAELLFACSWSYADCPTCRILGCHRCHVGVLALSCGY